MPTRQVYFFGRNPAMMALVDQQLKAAGIDAKGYLEEEALVADLASGDAKMLVIGGGVEDAPRARLREACEQHKVLVLEHFGGPGPLVEQIGSVLA